MAHTLPNLPYDYTALEPYIDAQTMEIHHGRHHKAYVDNLNKAIEGTEAEKLSLEDLMKNITNYPAAVRNNGGGHYNHSLFWTVLGNNGSKPSGKLADAIEAFGGLETLKEKVNAAGAARFGSGWAWVCVNNGKIEVCSTPNQDNPLMPDTGCNGTPIFGIDVWEHAYYLKYQNKRPDYLNAIWNVVNWEEVGKRFEAAL
ncbi:MAG: superoxide dismutase [Bacteroidetes bacterium 47-18]|nr:MAG: superoxide dismutase [Bacteroidetes bacterium 47-18]